MIETTDKPPRLGPSECLEVEVAYVIQDVIILTSNATNDEEFVFMQDSSMSRSAFWDRAGHLRLGPVRGFEIEDDEIG